MKSFLIGSLPFKDKEIALKFIKKFDIPTLCTLPQLDETEYMLHHAILGLKNFEYIRNRVHFKLTNKQISPFNFALENEFFDALNGEYKWQAAGPVTLIETMEMHEYDEFLFNEYLEKIVLTQRKFNQLNNTPAYFFLDEPMLGTSIDLLDHLIRFKKALSDSGEFNNIKFGLHCCSKLETDLSKLDFDLIALDFNLYSISEWDELQKELEDKLVAIKWDSDMNENNYPFKVEKFVSSSCGQALCKRDDLL